MNARMLLAWWNLVFVIPFGLALVYLALYTLTGVSFGDVDADAGLDADADVDADAHADVDADADAEADSDADAGGGHGHASFHAAAMNFIGVGRVPLSVLLMVLMMTWGATGFVVNQLALARFGAGPRLTLVSIPAALLAGVALTRLLVRAIDRWLPLNETTARRRHELLGRAGEAVFPITQQFGLAAVRDDSGELYQVPCQLDPKLDAPIPKGSRVRLVAYSAKTRSFYVTTSDSGGVAGASARSG